MQTFLPQLSARLDYGTPYLATLVVDRAISYELQVLDKRKFKIVVVAKLEESCPSAEEKKATSIFYLFTGPHDSQM